MKPAHAPLRLSGRGRPPGAQELEELCTLAQSTLRHLRTAQHFAHHGGNLRHTKIEAPIEIIDRLE